MLLDQLDAQLTQKHQGKCALLVYSAVTQCYQMLVLDAPMADAANAVPDVFTAEREPMTWELLASYSAGPPEQAGRVDRKHKRLSRRPFCRVS